MHLVIATRRGPDFPWPALAVEKRADDLRAADLRFTPAEAAKFLNQVMGLSL